MSQKELQVWDCEYQREMSVSPEAIWALWSDVPGWPRWNPGIKHIEIDGPFEAGTTFTMMAQTGESVSSRLREVQVYSGFVDETRLGELSIYVEHRIDVIDARRIRVVYSIEAFGPLCDEIGALVTADFPEVLSALAVQAEALVGVPL